MRGESRDMKKKGDPPYTVDETPYTVDETVLKRFDERQTVFGRMLHEPKATFYKRGRFDEIEPILARNEEGYSRVDFARVMGSWSVYDHFHEAYSWEKPKDPYTVMEYPKLARYDIDDPAEMSKEVKETAKFFGASLVGITEINRTWVYSHDRDGTPITIPEKYTSAIVMALAMDPARLIASPKFTSCAETGKAYSRMTFCISCMAEFIRNLGYDAIPMGNDLALSIPLAIDAGLGELGRNGLLITPEYGPCVRICKVFTDMPLEPDTPQPFGVMEFCKECRKCAEACEVDAISTEREPSYTTVCPSNNQGILRWAVNHDKCYQFWIENGGECSNCIAACPFFPGNSTKKENNHEDR
jgi:hypothetical protein